MQWRTKNRLFSQGEREKVSGIILHVLIISKLSKIIRVAISTGRVAITVAGASWSVCKKAVAIHQAGNIVIIIVIISIFIIIFKIFIPIINLLIIIILLIIIFTLIAKIIKQGSWHFCKKAVAIYQAGNCCNSYIARLLPSLDQYYLYYKIITFDSAIPLSSLQNHYPYQRPVIHHIHFTC